jgi:phosphopantothenoylcysteine decarboxylase / phosphopantothenate---cysteine ligase
LKGKNVILAITGSIAAYKSALLVRLLVKAGANVRVVLSPAALDFVTPLTLATLSKHEVMSDFTEDDDSGKWTNHVELALWGDLMVIAPCSANTLAKLATGICDNFLLAVYLSAKCPVMLAPAMDRDMYLHQSTQANLQELNGRGHIIVDPGTGELASGLEGKGRMAEAEELFEKIDEFFHPDLKLKGLNALVTAGPTYERIDPVRFIGNFSTGKMGYAIAEELARQGASVTLVSGPSHERVVDHRINLIKVTSAQEMFDACVGLWEQTNIGVMSAAVADYRPKQMAKEKIKKTSSSLSIELEKTTDILAHLGKNKTGQYLVGFALETSNELENAKLKLKNKNLDLIVLNSLNDKGAGFGHDTNKVTLLSVSNKITSFELKSKAAVAADIVRTIIEEK